MRRQEDPYRIKGKTGWYVTVYDEHKARHRMRGGKTKAEAVTFRDHYVQRVRDIDSNRITRKDLDVAEAAKIPVGEVVDDFLADIGPNVTAQHLRETERYVRKFARDEAVKTMAQVTTPVIRRWLRKQSAHDHSLARLRTFCRWCVDDHRLPEDPTAGINKRHPAPKKPARPLSMAEAHRLVDTCICSHRKARYLLGIQQGLRVREAGRLCWGDIDFENDALRLRAEITKMKRNDDLPLAPAVKEALLAIRPDQYGFGTPIFKGDIQRQTWMRDLDRAGIISIKGRLNKKKLKSGKVLPADGEVDGYGDDRGRVLSMQCLRKTYGTHLAMVEPNVSTVAKLMRHTDPKITLRLYQDARLMSLEDAQQKFASAWCQSGANKAPADSN